MGHTTSIDELLLTIESYAAGSERLSIFDNLSEHFRQLRTALLDLRGRKDDHFSNTAKRFWLSVERFIFVSLVCRRKIDAINHLIKYAVTEQNAIALAQGTRSLVEHVAVQSEIAARLESLRAGLKGQTDGTKINEALKKAEKFLHKCYFGTSPKIEQDDTKRALHINDCIRTLEKINSGIAEEYDFLCEFVHPNHGSNSLVSTDDPVAQLLSIETDFGREEVVEMADVAAKTLQSCVEIEGQIHGTVAMLGYYVNRFQQESAKVSNVFAERKLKPMGDGLSKETAYFFPNTRDYGESFELMYAHLEKLGVEIFGRKSKGIEGGSIYDLFYTTKGQIWFRVDLPADLLAGS